MLLPIDELNTLQGELSEIVRTIQAEAEHYDSIDFLIDLLASTVIPMVEEHLVEQYDQAYRMGVDGWLDSEPDEATRTAAIYGDVAGKTFADRIEEYAAAGLEQFVSKVCRLIETDGHRVRSEGTLAAGDKLNRAGYTVTKTWYGVMDEKERDKHVALEGVTIHYNNMFEIDSFHAPAPGLFNVPELDCNCRCELKINVSA